MNTLSSQKLVELFHRDGIFSIISGGMRPTAIWWVEILLVHFLTHRPLVAAANHSDLFITVTVPFQCLRCWSLDKRQQEDLLSSARQHDDRKKRESWNSQLMRLLGWRVSATYPSLCTGFFFSSPLIWMRRENVCFLLPYHYSFHVLPSILSLACSSRCFYGELWEKGRNRENSWITCLFLTLLIMMLMQGAHHISISSPRDPSCYCFACAFHSKSSPSFPSFTIYLASRKPPPHFPSAENGSREDLLCV